MEEKLSLLQGFLEELSRYNETSQQIKVWYAQEWSLLEQEQREKHALNEENFKKQQAAFISQQEKNSADREALQEKIREKILQKKTVLKKSIENNEQIRDRILHTRDEIARPEYFQYAYRYREYGDFHPMITKLEDFHKIDLKAKVIQINQEGSGVWISKLKGLFKSEDMMTEYASFANLLEKARYLCEVENDALKEKASMEIGQLEKELTESEEAFLSQGADLLKKQQQIQKDNGELNQMFISACEEERKSLQEAYRNKQLATYDDFKRTLQEQYPVNVMKEVYEALEKAQNNNRKYICEDGIPLPVKLGQLWFAGEESIKNDKVKQIMERWYPFFITEGRLLIPGIV